jgi:hypothetical protein
MLWIEYNSSEITKEVVDHVVTEISKLTSSVPVAAVDWKPDGFGIIASDSHCDSWSSHSEPVGAPSQSDSRPSQPRENKVYTKQNGKSDESREEGFENLSGSEFSACLKVKSQQFVQSLEIAFKPTHRVSDHRESCISLDPVIVEASALNKIQDPSKRGARRPVPPQSQRRFITDQIAISVGAEGGDNIRIRNATPRKSEFHLNSPKPGDPVKVNYIPHKTGQSAALDFMPRFEDSVPGRSCWRYKVLQGEKHSTFECSSESPPLHSAAVLYDRDCLPQHIFTQVSTDFRLSKPTCASLSETLQTPNIRHISVDMKMRIKSTMLDSKIESPKTAGERIVVRVDVDFEKTVGCGIPGTIIHRR